jgi:crotonobetainyl-CoA:carnitine CoA-transferase CaiB-like acyl-CoA transferase
VLRSGPVDRRGAPAPAQHRTGDLRRAQRRGAAGTGAPFSRTGAEIQRPPSFAGQHTDEALADWGLDAATIAKLETGAVK